MCIPDYKCGNVAYCVTNPELLIHVQLDSPWYKDPKLQVLQTVTNFLVRSKCVVAELIPRITALTAIIDSSAALALAT